MRLAYGLIALAIRCVSYVLAMLTLPFGYVGEFGLCCVKLCADAAAEFSKASKREGSA